LPTRRPSAKAGALGWLRGIVLVAVMAAAGRAAADDALARLHARGTLRWGGDMQGGEPYVFQDPRDRRRLAGFEVEIAEGLARRLGVRAEFAQNDWQTLIPSLERGDFDVALNGIEVTPARRARVAFTRPYYGFAETLVVRRDEGPVHGLGDLRGARVGTLEGSLALDLLRAAPGVEVVLYEGVEEPYLDLERGRLRAVLLDNIIAARYGLPRATLRAAGTVGEGVYAIAVRPSEPELLGAVDGASAGSSGTRARRRSPARRRRRRRPPRPPGRSPTSRSSSAARGSRSSSRSSRWRSRSPAGSC